MPVCSFSRRVLCFRYLINSFRFNCVI